MVELSTLSIPAVVLQGRGGYGFSGCGTAEGFADILNLQSMPMQNSKLNQASLPITFDLRQGALPTVTFTVQGDTVFVENVSEDMAQDMDVVVLIPAGETGRDDLIRLIAQLLGLEENDDFLREFSALVEEVLPESELSEPITLKGLDELLQKLRDLLSEKEKSSKILLPLFALFIFPATEAASALPEPEQPGAIGTVAPAAPGDQAELPLSAASQEGITAQTAETETNIAQSVEANGTQPTGAETNAIQTAEAETTVIETGTGSVQSTDWTQDVQSVTVTQTPESETIPLQTQSEIPPEPIQAAVSTETAETGDDTPQTVPDDVPPEEKAFDRPRRYADFARHKLRFTQAIQNDSAEAQTEEPALIRGEAPPEEIRMTAESTETKSGQEEEPGAGMKDTNTSKEQTIAQPLVQTTNTSAETVQDPSQSPVRQALAENMIDQIVQNAALRQNANGATLTMELAPKFLGKISLVLTATADGVIAKIRTENDAARMLLSGSMEALKTSLKEAGINMKNIEISDSTVDWDYTRGGQGNTQPDGGSRNRYGFEENSGNRIRTDGFGDFAESDMIPGIGSLYRTGRVAAQETLEAAFDYRA